MDDNKLARVEDAVEAWTQGTLSDKAAMVVIRETLKTRVEAPSEWGGLTVPLPSGVSAPRSIL